jgi:hypothetical protein
MTKRGGLLDGVGRRHEVAECADKHLTEKLLPIQAVLLDKDGGRKHEGPQVAEVGDARQDLDPQFGWERLQLAGRARSGQDCMGWAALSRPARVDDGVDRHIHRGIDMGDGAVGGCW